MLVPHARCVAEDPVDVRRAEIRIRLQHQGNHPCHLRRGSGGAAEPELVVRKGVVALILHVAADPLQIRRRDRRRMPGAVLDLLRRGQDIIAWRDEGQPGAILAVARASALVVASADPDDRGAVAQARDQILEDLLISRLRRCWSLPWGIARRSQQRRRRRARWRGRGRRGARAGRGLRGPRRVRRTLRGTTGCCPLVPAGDDHRDPGGREGKRQRQRVQVRLGQRFERQREE